MADKRISQLVDRGTIANNDVVPIVVSGAVTTNKATISSIQTFMQGNLDFGVTSVGLSMPSAFVVSASPVTTSGNISVTGAGTVSQYIRGNGTLADFPSISGGGSSVSYYLNGSVSQGTIGGVAYLEMNKVPILGTGTNFNISANGYIASFITDAGDPALLQIPGGNWNFETYFNANSNAGNPTFYIELYKVNSGGTATLIASNSATPESISFGSTIHAYFSSLAVPTTTLALTDRLALRYYVNNSGRTITLHTENSHLCQIITTFTTGLTALNGLTAQVQNFTTGTSGTDFGISSTGSTHTFNLPTASATNRGALSSADWSTFTNDRVPYTGATTNVDLGSNTLSSRNLIANGGFNTGALLLKNANNASLINTGYFTLTPSSTNTSINFGFSTGASTWKSFILSSHLLTDNAPTIFVFPNGGGTLALTSDLSSYVTLGTTQSITGAKTFDSTTSTFVAFNTSNASGGALTFRRNGANLGHIGNSGVLGVGILDDLEVRSGISRALHLKTDGGQLTLASTGAVTLTGALNGTSATFSSSVTAEGTFFGKGNVVYQNGSTFILNVGSDQLMYGGTNSDGGVFVYGNNKLHLSTNSQRRLTIDGSGNVGIGTPAPAEKLHVFASAGTSAKFVLEEGGAQSVLWTTRNSSTNGDLRFQTMIGGTVATRMLIDYSGNVGIGTDSPTNARLEVVGGIPSLFTADSQASSSTYGGSIFYRNHTGVGQGNGLSFALNNASNSRVEYAYIGSVIEGNTAGNLQSGAIIFAPTLAGAREERMRITSDGYARLSASSGGIQFNGDTAAANALDDYEEGTWTPTVVAASGTYTSVTNQRGTYTKIGNQVTVQFYFIVSNKGTGTSGAKITNLPFTVKSTSGGDQYVGSMINTSTSVASSVIAAQNSTSADIYKYDGTDSITVTQGNAGSLTYFV